AVLLVGFDVNATGALASVTASEGLLAVAIVLAPARGPRSRTGLEITLRNGPTSPAPLLSPAARALAGNAMADALPFFEALAATAMPPLTLPLSASLALRLEPLA
ncbi:MAG: hypothetical protein ABIZ18_04265, partial [Caldimonas sp.]